MNIAHRGLWNHQNKIEGILKVASHVDAVEVDVRVNSKGVLVLCHDRVDVDRINDTLEDLCNISEKLHIVLDIKGNLAKPVVGAIRGSAHEWELCSFDQRCVMELLSIQKEHKVGILSSGFPGDEILGKVDFVSQDYEFLDEDMIYIYRLHNLRIYVFGTSNKVDGVEGVIRNVLLA